MQLSSLSDFALTSVMVTNYMDDVAKDGKWVRQGETSLPLIVLSETADAVQVRRTYATPHNEAILSVAVTAEGVILSAENRSARGYISGVSGSTPWIQGGGARAAIFTPRMGGQLLGWVAPGGQSSRYDGRYPGAMYSPYLGFYDAATGSGLGVVLWNDALAPMSLSWELGGDVKARVNFQWCPHLRLGRTGEMQIHFHRDDRYPGALVDYYRDSVFQPFMQRCGYPQGVFDVTGCIAGGGVPNRAGGFRAGFNAAVASNAAGWIAWPYEAGCNFNPSPRDLPWWNDLPIANAPFVLGCLVNPWNIMVGRQIPGCTIATQPSSLPVRRYWQRILHDMVAAGLTCAYWDAPHDDEAERSWFDGHVYAQILATWKRAGVTLIPENTCDLSGWITGTLVYTGWAWQDPLAFGATPGAKPCVMIQEDDASGYRVKSAGRVSQQKVPVAGEAVTWWEDVLARGGVPVLNAPQFAVRKRRR